MRRQRDTVRYAQELLDLRLHRNQDRAQRGPQPRCSQAEHQVLDKRVDRRAADWWLASRAWIVVVSAACLTRTTRCTGTSSRWSAEWSGVGGCPGGVNSGA